MTDIPEDVRKAMERIESMPPSTPTRLYSPGPNATALYRKHYPGTIIAEYDHVTGEWVNQPL